MHPTTAPDRRSSEAEPSALLAAVSLCAAAAAAALGLLSSSPPSPGRRRRGAYAGLRLAPGPRHACCTMPSDHFRRSARFTVHTSAHTSHTHTHTQQCPLHATGEHHVGSVYVVSAHMDERVISTRSRPGLGVALLGPSQSWSWSWSGRDFPR